MALTLSILALLGTFYQLYLQRVHNEKSLKPLIQIDLTDDAGLIYVRICNNGVGPFIAEKLTFVKEGKAYHSIQDCLTLSAKSYQRVSVNKSVRKVVAPGCYLEVFSKQFEMEDTDAEMDDVRRQLAALTLKVEGVDIYDNKIIIERGLDWFLRHSQ